jgi:hypothetical protein
VVDQAASRAVLAAGTAGGVELFTGRKYSTITGTR